MRRRAPGLSDSSDGQTPLEYSVPPMRVVLTPHRMELFEANSCIKTVGTSTIAAMHI